MRSYERSGGYHGSGGEPENTGEEKGGKTLKEQIFLGIIGLSGGLVSRRRGDALFWWGLE